MAPTVDITQLNLSELRDLNLRCAAQIRRLEIVETAQAAASLQPGQKVAFRKHGKDWQGVIRRINRATVAVEVPDEKGKGTTMRVDIPQLHVVQPARGRA